MYPGISISTFKKNILRLVFRTLDPKFSENVCIHYVIQLNY